MSALYNNYILYLSLSPLLCRRVMSAPNVLRIGTKENIFVECQDCTEDPDIRVKIRVMSHPTKGQELTSTYVTLSKTNKFQIFGEIKVSIYLSINLQKKFNITQLFSIHCLCLFKLVLDPC